MRTCLIHDLAECTEYRQVLQARTPRLVHASALILGALLGTAVGWAAWTRASLVVRAPGRIRPTDTAQKVFNPVRGEVLSGSAGGRVREVFFAKGTRVKKGDVLLRFDTERLDNEIARVKRKIQDAEEELAKRERMAKLLTSQYQAARAKAEAELSQAKEEVRQARRRQEREVKIAEGKVAQDRQEEERVRKLVLRGVEARATWEKASAALKAAKEQLAKARLPVEEGRIGVLRKALGLVEKEYAVRSEELELQRSARKAEAEAARVELANLMLERQQAVLRSPADGVVTEGEVKKGDLLEPGKVVAEISASEGFRFEALVPSEEVGPLKVGMRTRIKLDAYDYQRYGVAEGKVVFISPDSRVGKGKPGAFYIVRIEVDGDEIGRNGYRGKLKLGMAGRAEIVTGEESLLSLLLKKVRRTISLG
jgi:multidrug efflux pump subunit AcrA (membrane-fusion protein)